MAFEAKTILDKKEIVGNTIGVRLDKQVWNGDIKISGDWHRFNLTPAEGPDPLANFDWIISSVNNDLVALGYPTMNQEDVDNLKKQCIMEWVKT